VTLVDSGASLEVHAVRVSSSEDCAEQADTYGAQLRRDSGMVSSAEQVLVAGEGGLSGTRSTYGSGLLEGSVTVLCGPALAMVAVSAAPLGSPGVAADVDAMIASLRVR
jgi:hypothetical protein